MTFSRGLTIRARRFTNLFIVRDQVSRIIASLLASRRPFSSSEVAAAAQVSRQAAHRALKRLEASGAVERLGAGRTARWQGTTKGPLRLRFPRATLAEDRVWSEYLMPHPAVRALPSRARRILGYAATEMLNNAIDHSQASEIELRFESLPGAVAIEIIDDGVGIFDRVRKALGLADALEAAAELNKGKVTTDPARHTGEGIFFTSRVARRFEAESGAVRWLVDNDREEAALLEAPRRKGTRIRVEVPVRPRRSLQQVFARFTDDFQFTRSEIVVKLFEHGREFVSRSEARRLLHGLEKFRVVTLDFKGVKGIGQGFADEVFRVWPSAHRQVELKPVRMAAPVSFMVRRATAR